MQAVEVLCRKGASAMQRSAGAAQSSISIRGVRGGVKGHGWIGGWRMRTRARMRMRG